MKPIHIAGIAAAGVTLLGAGAALAASGRRPEPAGRHPGGAAPAGTGGGGDAPPAADDDVVAPAYGYLDLWTSEDRRALLDLQRELGLDPRIGGLAGVIAHESGGDPAAPHDRSGTPRGGLIQVTSKANLPGYTTDDAVWAIRGQGRIAQLRGVVRDFYRRQMPHGPPADQGAAALIRRNYLPAVADKPSTFVLGVKPGSVGPGGERPEDHLAPKLTLGSNYTANHGLDPVGRGWFTWEDVDRKAVREEQSARARGWVRVSGARVQPGDLAIAGIADLAIVGALAPLATDMVSAIIACDTCGLATVTVPFGHVGAILCLDCSGGVSALRSGWREVAAARDASPADCPCRDAVGPLIAEWDAYEAAPAARGDDALIHLWSLLREARRIQSGAAAEPLPGEAVLDVRERGEFAARPRQGAENVPLSEIDRDGVGRVTRWAAGRPVVVYCASGVRAGRIAARLHAAGLNARNGHESHACKLERPPTAGTSEAALWA